MFCAAMRLYSSEEEAGVSAFTQSFGFPNRIQQLIGSDCGECIQINIVDNQKAKPSLHSVVSRHQSGLASEENTST